MGQVRRKLEQDSEDYSGHTDEELIPHVLRVDKARQWLAHYNEKTRQVRLYTLGNGDQSSGFATPRTYRVRWMSGRVQKFRWLQDSRTLVFLTDVNAYTVRLPVRRTQGSVYARRIFRGDLPEETEWRDIRALENAFVLHYRTYDFEEDRLRDQVRLVRQRGAWFLKPLNISPPELLAFDLSVRSGNRLVFTNERLNKRRQLTTYKVHSNGQITQEERADCRASNDAECDVVNWSPYSNTLCYAQGDGTISVHGAQGVARMTLGDKPDWNTVRGLWLNPAEDTVLASNDQTVGMWRTTGERLWTWNSTVERDVTSVHFNIDGRFAWVGAGARLLRISDGKAQEVYSFERAPMPENPQSSETQEKLDADDSDYNIVESGHEQFVDNIVPLGGGAVAFAVVTLDWVESYD